MANWRGVAAPNDGAITNLGTTASTGHSLGAGDVLIGGKLEVDGDAFFDGNLLLPLENDAVTPTLAFGDGGDGIFNKSNGVLSMALDGATKYQFTTAYMGTFITDPGARIMFETVTATNPGFAFSADEDTGGGSGGADIYSLIAGGVEGIRITEATTITSRLSDKIRLSRTSEGNAGSFNIQTTVEVHTLAAAGTSDTTTISIPSGALALGASFTVNTAVVDDAGDDTWTAAFVTGDASNLTPTAGAAAQNSKVNTILVPVKTTDVTQIRFTANGGNFSAGVIEIVAYYMDLTGLANV